MFFNVESLLRLCSVVLVDEWQASTRRYLPAKEQVARGSRSREFTHLKLDNRPPAGVSVRDMIDRIHESNPISDEKALHIREVSEEKIADPNVRQTIAAHRSDEPWLDGTYRGQLNGDIQDAFNNRSLFEPLSDPKYTDPSGIFDIMAYTVIQKGLESTAVG